MKQYHSHQRSFWGVDFFVELVAILATFIIVNGIGYLLGMTEVFMIVAFVLAGVIIVGVEFFRIVRLIREASMTSSERRQVSLGKDDNT